MISIRQFIRQYHNLVLLTISGFIVPLITNLFSSWLESSLGKTPAQLLQLIAILVAMSVSVWVLVLFFRVTRRSEVLVPQEMQARPHAGLIVLVGPGRRETPSGSRPNVASEAIVYHLGKGSLRRVWLITSDAGVPVIEELRKQFSALIKIKMIHDILDINETYLAVRDIYEKEASKEGLDPHDIICDYTGGTKPMTVGMALAAANGQFPMQFTSGKVDTLSVPIQTVLASQDTGEE